MDLRTEGMGGGLMSVGLSKEPAEKTLFLNPSPPPFSKGGELLLTVLFHVH
jgi:hypothetical protein